MELTLFIEAHMMLCFGFFMRTMLITHHFRCCRAVFTQSKDISALHAALPARRSGAQGAERTETGLLTQTAQRDVLCHMAQCSAIKAGVKKEEKGMFVVMAFFFP